MTYVWDAENAPGNALHPSLRLYRGMQLSRIHPTSTLLLPVQKKEVRAMNSKKTKKGDRHWYDYLWIASMTYLILGFFNIMFAWLGLICFLVPLAISIVTGSKLYCNRYCDRGQLFSILGKKLHLSPNREIPGWMKSKAFRYGFLVFFLVMFCQMLFNTYLVFRGTSGLKQAVTVLWTFRLPWQHAYHGTGLPLWTAQFAFGFYSVMLTSTILGLATMVLFRPRSWCVYCPMGTMTQMICKAKAGACPGAASGCGTSGCSSLGCGSSGCSSSGCGASGCSSSGCSSSDCSSSCSNESLS